jgi:Stage II sporulation protein E (SpoIIE)
MAEQAVLSAAHVDMALRVLPMHEGQPCGDAAGAFELPPGVASPALLLAIVDGLGHGVAAAQAADAALAQLAHDPALALPDLLRELDAALLSTRGAAVGLARIDGQRLQYAGVGNTRAIRWRGDHMLRLSSQYGIVGGGLPVHVTVNEIDFVVGDWLLLFTDGLDEMLALPMHLPEWERDPALLCTHLLARWRQGRDDAGVLVCRRGGD